MNQHIKTNPIQSNTEIPIDSTNVLVFNIFMTPQYQTMAFHLHRKKRAGPTLKGNPKVPDTQTYTILTKLYNPFFFWWPDHATQMHQITKTAPQTAPPFLSERLMKAFQAHPSSKARVSKGHIMKPKKRGKKSKKRLNENNETNFNKWTKTKNGGCTNNSFQSPILKTVLRFGLKTVFIFSCSPKLFCFLFLFLLSSALRKSHPNHLRDHRSHEKNIKPIIRSINSDNFPLSLLLLVRYAAILVRITECKHLSLSGKCRNNRRIFTSIHASQSDRGLRYGCFSRVQFLHSIIARKQILLYPKKMPSKRLNTRSFGIHATYELEKFRLTISENTFGDKELISSSNVCFVNFRSNATNAAAPAMTEGRWSIKFTSKITSNTNNI